MYRISWLGFTTTWRVWMSKRALKLKLWTNAVGTRIKNNDLKLFPKQHYDVRYLWNVPHPNNARKRKNVVCQCGKVSHCKKNNNNKTELDLGALKDGYNVFFKITAWEKQWRGSALDMGTVYQTCLCTMILPWRARWNISWTVWFYLVYQGGKEPVESFCKGETKLGHVQPHRG